MTFKTKLKPVSDDRTSDANQCKEEEFKNIDDFSFNDRHIRKEPSPFIQAYKPQIDSWRIEIDYEQKYNFACKVQPIDPNGVIFYVLKA